MLIHRGTVGMHSGTKDSHSGETPRGRAGLLLLARVKDPATASKKSDRGSLMADALSWGLWRELRASC